MATNTGKGSRKGAVDNRTQVKNPVRGDYVKRNEDPKSKSDGNFLAIKKDGAPFKGVAKEVDYRRVAKEGSDKWRKGDLDDRTVKSERKSVVVASGNEIADAKKTLVGIRAVKVHTSGDVRRTDNNQALPRMTATFAMARAVGNDDDPKFDGVAFLRTLR